MPESEEPTTEIVAESEEPTDMELSEEVPEEEHNEAIRDDSSNTHYVQADITNSFREEHLDELDKYGRKKLPTRPFQNPSPLPTTEDSTLRYLLIYQDPHQHHHHQIQHYCHQQDE